jgi:hypothetical protein
MSEVFKTILRHTGPLAIYAARYTD